MMQVIADIGSLRHARQQSKGVVGLVPTMGALHAGHMALVEAARQECHTVIVSIFVNPTQFGPNDDLEAYPRDLPGDLSRLETAGTDIVFTPTPALMYPPGFQTHIEVTEVTRNLEGASRSGHFRGVATVVTKLFNLVQPDRAYFGQKDAQQVVTIRRLVHDLNMPIHIIPVPTVRETDGLALSSRNQYLNVEERRAAIVLSRALNAAQAAYESGERHPDALRAAMQREIETEPRAEIDYTSAADARTLRELEAPSEQPLLLSLTVRIGQPRLLDNRLLPAHLNTAEGLLAALGTP